MLENLGVKAGPPRVGASCGRARWAIGRGPRLLRHGRRAGLFRRPTGRLRRGDRGAVAPVSVPGRADPAFAVRRPPPTLRRGSCAPHPHHRPLGVGGCARFRAAQPAWHRPGPPSCSLTAPTAGTGAGRDPGRPITDPSWTPLFLAPRRWCRHGALLSHAVIVARGLGIPAVLSVPGITGVADGTMLHVDGTNGTVRIGTADGVGSADADLRLESS